MGIGFRGRVRRSRDFREGLRLFRPSPGWRGRSEFRELWESVSESGPPGVGVSGRDWALFNVLGYRGPSEFGNYGNRFQRTSPAEQGVSGRVAPFSSDSGWRGRSEFRE